MDCREKRVVLLADAQTHMMPALAHKMAHQNHDLVLGDAKDGLADELIKLGARVEVVINTSASALRPHGFAALYCATRAGANALVQAAALTVAPYGVTLNGTGTYAMNCPNFLHDVGADIDPKKRREVEEALPMKKLCDPEEAAHFIAALIDGKGTFQTAQIFAIDGGWSLM